MDEHRAGGSLEYTRKQVACGIVDSRGDLRIALEHDPAETRRRSEVLQFRLRNFLSGPVHDHFALLEDLRLSRAGAGDCDGAAHGDYDRRDLDTTQPVHNPLLSLDWLWLAYFIKP